jgi:hypothetical protein
VSGASRGMAPLYAVMTKEADASALHGGASRPCADQWPTVMVLRGGSRPQGMRVERRDGKGVYLADGNIDDDRTSRAG